jgi:alkaline phosphatase
MITDSAASGTAFAAGHKSYNGAISVTPEGLPVGSILEAAKLGGLKTGLVSTTSISDATPAGNVFTLGNELEMKDRLLTNL